MGLAASQGRLLLLTARKSDLEYRSQEISQRRLILATELESVSTKYARATANRQMKLTRSVNQGETNETQTVNLTYRSLIQAGMNNDSSGISDYRIKNARGQVVVSDSSELPRTAEDAGFGDGVTVKVEGNKAIVSGTDKATGELVHLEYVVDRSLADTSETENYFQEGLRNGRFLIEQLSVNDANGNENGNPNTTEGSLGVWSPVAWSGMTIIQDNYYTDDDATAQAEYQTASARVQAQDKKLETDQKQIETQHKAVETEFESVQKVITSNIESSFKMFS